MAVTVLLVDDVAELRAVIRQALRLRGGFEVLGEAGDAAGAIRAARDMQPDVVVLDLGLPDLAGKELVGSLRDAAPEAQVVVYTGSVTSDRTEVSGQVEGFVHKDQDVGYLVELLADLGRRDHRAAAIDLGPDTRDVARARRFLSDQCRRWGCADIAEDAVLVATELVTNALVHAGSQCRLTARLASGVLRLEVGDEGPGVPDPRDTSGTDESGRGLLLVSVLCSAWGVDATRGAGKVVWAELASPEERNRLSGPGAVVGRDGPVGAGPRR
ncbi:MAG TPA: response regulator [Acidimicrobiales bacterium]|nr:response regulator [Acidimicrobiales bacterium]